MISDRQSQAAALIADSIDGCRFGYEGVEGYRKSTDLFKFLRGHNTRSGITGNCRNVPKWLKGWEGVFFGLCGPLFAWKFWGAGDSLFYGIILPRYTTGELHDS
jgi:hypothetical protein